MAGHISKVNSPQNWKREDLVDVTMLIKESCQCNKPPLYEKEKQL